MRGEPERMLRNHEESSARSQVTSRTFQRVKVALTHSHMIVITESGIVGERSRSSD